MRARAGLRPIGVPRSVRTTRPVHAIHAIHALRAVRAFYAIRAIPIPAPIPALIPALRSLVTFRARAAFLPLPAAHAIHTILPGVTSVRWSAPPGTPDTVARRGKAPARPG
ncbi:hypothetical protein GCM10010344_44590 [Streptomyces bluensis]|nr:hypothetical protein GCM10010344_44590 [Streptomyces bluensis]